MSDFQTDPVIEPDSWMCRLCGGYVSHRMIDHRQENQLRARIHQVIDRWWRTASDDAKEMFFQKGGDLVDIEADWRAKLDAERLEAMWSNERPSTPPTPSP